MYRKKVLSNFIFIALCLVLGANSSMAVDVVDGSHIMDQDMSENLCALTFDDGPSRNTPALLDMLSAYGVPATFFLLGENAKLYPSIVKRMVAEGHEVGNHSWSHPNLRRLSSEQQAMQIMETDALLRSHGATPFFFRPPYGAFDEITTSIVKNMGLSIMLWSMDSKDWKKLPDDYAKLRSTRGTVYEEGNLKGVFLFHDTHKTTVDDLPKIIADLRAGGCQRFVTVSEYLKGIADPEPGSLMTRRPAVIPGLREGRILKYAAGSGPVSLARCSKPMEEDSQRDMQLDDAHAAVDLPSNGI